MKNIKENRNCYILLFMSKMTLSEELTWRGFVKQSTFNDITELDTKKMKFYFGVDPSASSMTIGNLASAMMCKVFIKHGYEPVLLVGGATGLIGDPDGKAQERDLRNKEEIEINKKGIISQYKSIFSGLEFQIVDNYDWFKEIGYLEFLREVGKHVPMRQMLSRDFVQSRLGEEGAGISYAEFSYSLIQGYDFLHLHNEYGVDLQLSGADQWGNSVTGVDLVRRKTGDEVHVWSGPLVVNKTTGVKFGKTEDGAVWLDSNLTSVFKYYQFWLNLDDAGCEEYLKIYSTLDKEEIDSVISEFNNDRSSRHAQKVLAREATSLLHGKERAKSAEKVSNVLFGGENFMNLNKDDLGLLSNELTTFEYTNNIIDLLVSVKLANSKTEARNFLNSGAINLNGRKISIEEYNFIDGINLLKKGKNSFVLVKK
jgi:tyrosyl-tRNA synthetase